MLGLVAAAIVVVLPLLVAGGWFLYQLDPPGGPGGEVSVDVEPGWGNAEIADALADEDVVGSSFAFRAYVRLTDAGPFQAGSYSLRTKLGVRAAVSMLEAGPEFAYEELALPPGLTLVEIAARVGELEGRDAESFHELATSGTIRSRLQPDDVASLEGVTWPDTYFVSAEQSDEELLELLVDRFDSEAAAAGIDDAATSGLTPYESVVVASLIQTEAGVATDRPLISAVIRNRLADGMPLQIDATVLYARGGGDRPITESDKALASPHNTYAVAGLPPTPIATITTEALKAALVPADVPYRFYVLIDPSGEHAFAVTFEEHERNVDEARALGLLD